jgi:hypothetical protein
MQLTIVTATGKRQTLALPPDEPLTAARLQAAAARSLALPPGALLRLVQGGQPLASDEDVTRLKDGGEACSTAMWLWPAIIAARRLFYAANELPRCRTPPLIPARLCVPHACAADTVLAAVAPRAPPKELRDAVSGGGGEDEEEDEAEALLRLRLPPDAPRWRAALAHLLHRRLRLPEALVALLLAVRGRVWLGLAAWMAGARLAAAAELGPLYIISTLFAGMLLNLGQRKEGEWSAYSLFNRDFRRLPGQMTAEDLDAAVRRGQL